MSTDIIELREFYLSSLGLTVRRLLRQHRETIWPSLKGKTILGLGFVTPLLRPLVGEASQILSFMPAQQGALYWPKEGPNISALVDFENLPLANESIDTAIIVHALESVTDPIIFLQEVWRVLKGHGQILIIVPNRLGIWAHNDRTPFGNGQPYSEGQIRKILHEQGFLINQTLPTLYFPPTSSRFIHSIAGYLEQAGQKIFPSFGGLLMIEGTKQLYAPLQAKSQSYPHRLILPLPVLSSRTVLAKLTCNY